ncbi:hypothetical protein [Moritella sp. F3]|uniref:hypothetical protein n=1 Tax=Moritella sp. F3 TaxID=2718882 RepID=UPI0018E0C887|nr:hypothetical protein [Moritella sp. F3]GIC77639.1 hypothetical protein FMO001_23660 [Moritella sp. F1]GIC82052.1 hypothetical protein FMO003_23330 [Moritella sp. F3]
MINSIEELKHNGKIKSDILTALINMLVKKALLKLMDPIHEALCAEAMVKFKPVYILDGSGTSQDKGTAMTNFDHLYLASDEIAGKIFDWHKSELVKKDFEAEEPFCPYLVAKNALFNCESMLIDVMAEYTSVRSSSPSMTLELRAKWLNRIVVLLISLAEDTGTELNIFKHPQDAKAFLASM